MDRPKLRKVERFEHERDAGPHVVLRDPLGIAEPVALEAQFAPVLDLLDGSRTVAQIRQSLLMRGSLDLPADDLADFVRELGEAGWLDDERFLERWAEAHQAFLAEDPRPPRLAGVLYPAPPEDLRAALAHAIVSRDGRMVDGSTVAGVVVPHGPLEVVGRVLDATLRGLPTADDVECVVILGTDHGPGLLPYAITTRRYGTPLGTPAVASGLAEALVRRLPWTNREEIRHKDALSIELAVVYLMGLYGDACPAVLPVLCGQTVLDDTHAAQVDAFIGTLETLLEDRRVLLWASAELSHAGPAYGRPAITTSVAADVAVRDEACLDALIAGRSERFARRCSEDHPQGRPSGGAALTTLARLLPVGYRAELAIYEQTPVPGPNEGTAGLAGLRMHEP